MEKKKKQHKLIPTGQGVTKYTNPKDLKNVITSYFEQMREQERPLTITGLCIAVGFKSRQSLLDYGDKEDFGHIILDAKLRCQNYAEEKLFTRNSQGVMFNLINNYKWRNRMDIVSEGKYYSGVAKDTRALTPDVLEARFKKLTKVIKKEIRDKRKEDTPQQDQVEDKTSDRDKIVYKDKDITPERIVSDNTTLKRAQDIAKGQ